MGKKKSEIIVLKYGDKGVQVRKAQKLLKLDGSKILVNGEYTIGMSTAVKAFQKRHKLPATGTIDQKTWEELTRMELGRPVRRSVKPKK